VLLAKYFLGDPVNKNEMGRACGMCGGEEMCVHGFGGDLRERHQFENLVVDGRIILKVIIMF